MPLATCSHTSCLIDIIPFKRDRKQKARTRRPLSVVTHIRSLEPLPLNSYSPAVTKLYSSPVTQIYRRAVHLPVRPSVRRSNSALRFALRPNEMSYRNYIWTQLAVLFHGFRFMFLPTRLNMRNKTGYTAKDAPSMRTFHLRK